MNSQLTRSERQLAIGILLLLTCVGLAFAAAGKDDPLGVHGFLIMAAAIVGIFAVISGYFAPEPGEERFDSYYDAPSKIGLLIAMGWAAFGLFVGDWVAWQLAYPDLNFEAAWTSFGRLRPVHTTSVIFGFGGNGLIATSFYVMQRTSRARLPDQLSPLFVLFGYNLFCLLAVTGYMMGVTHPSLFAAISPNSGIGPMSKEVEARIAAVKAQSDIRIPTLMVYGDVDSGGSIDGQMPAQGVVRGAFDELKTFDHITTQALGSRRFEVTFTGPGGHSWSDFGLGNPIHALCRAVALFSETRLGRGPKSAINVGLIEGGSSVNAIAQTARAKVDIRSESNEKMDELVEILSNAVDRARDLENQRATAGKDSSGGFDRTRTFTIFCGKIFRSAINSSSGPLSAMIEANFSAVSIPSPVVASSRNKICPDCSPPRFAPMCSISSST